ncbi:MAG: metallophosphoesterase [Erythrobacter sp.]|nr:metallophosphoesterase [Erythrobacter sp.]
MPTRFFHISDVHFGVEDPAALAHVADVIRKERPDALICTGDLTQRAKHSEYAAAAEWFAALDVPVVLEPGNHDMPYYNLIERFADPYRRYRRLKERVASDFASEHVVLVPLKTTVRAQPRFPWSDGVVTRNSLADTLARLSDLADDPRVVIVTAHHPLLGPDDRHNPTIGGDKAFTALAAAGADIVISGHVHRPFDEVRTRGGRAVRMIGAGTLSTRLRHGEPASYQVLTFDDDGRVAVDLRRLS